MAAVVSAVLCKEHVQTEEVQFALEQFQVLCAHFG